MEIIASDSFSEITVHKEFLLEVIDANNHVSALANTEGISWHVYPNPVHDLIEVQGITIENMLCFVIDIHGRVVQEGKLKLQRIDVTTLIKGIYCLTLISEKEIQSKAIIIR